MLLYNLDKWRLLSFYAFSTCKPFFGDPVFESNYFAYFLLLFGKEFEFFVYPEQTDFS